MSFLKAPSWAQPTLSDDEEETSESLFSHSKNFLAIHTHSIEQRKLQAGKQAEKDAQREGRKKERVDKEDDARKKRMSPDADGGDFKKRRITADESARLLASVGIQPVVVDSDSEDDSQPPPPLQTGLVRRSPRKPCPAGSAQGAEARIDLASAAPISEEESDEDSDPEIAALQRKAREKQRWKVEQEQRSSTPGGGDGREAQVGGGGGGFHHAPAADPTISLLVSSPMPNTAPLLVKRKLSQSLGAVREAWCQKQNLPRDVADQVFFTWRGRRLYNVTTCQRLGIEVDARGHVVRADDRDKDGAAKVHVVAMTEELLRREKMDKARQAGGEGDDPAAESETHGVGVGIGVGVGVGVGDGDGDEPARSSKREVKIIVKARDKKPVQVRVFSTTKILKIQNYARKQMGYPPDQAVYLQFDGERLDPHAEVGHTEIEDMDNLDLLLEH